MRVSKVTVVTLVGLFVLAAVMMWLVISGSGLLPGDNGIEPIADPTEGQDGQLMNLAAWPWAMVVLVFTIVLGLGIAYAQLRTKRVTPAEHARTEAATRALHREERDPDFKD